MFFKEPLTECFFVEPQMILLWHRCEEPFKALLFLRVYLNLHHNNRPLEKEEKNLIMVWQSLHMIA